MHSAPTSYKLHDQDSLSLCRSPEVQGLSFQALKYHSTGKNQTFSKWTEKPILSAHVNTKIDLIFANTEWSDQYIGMPLESVYNCIIAVIIKDYS